MTLIRDKQGSALVAALFFITALSVTATVIVWITGSERRVTSNEYAHTRSFYAGDAGAEQAINWIRTRPIPPAIVNIGNNAVEEMATPTYISSDHKYQFDVIFDRARPRPGWGQEYRDFYYTVDSQGESVHQASARIESRSSRIFRLGY